MQWISVKDKEPNFAFGKKIGIANNSFVDIPILINVISKLLYCMKEINKNYGTSCEFFRLDFRYPYLDEQFQFPRDCCLLDFKWGSKDELDELEKEKTEKNN